MAAGGSGWSRFQEKHVPDSASRLDEGYEAWGNLEWNAWLERRLGRDYSNKKINSVVGAWADTIKTDFLQSGPHQTYAKNNGQTMHWSNSKYTIYQFQRIDGGRGYRGKVCEGKYIVVRLEDESSLSLPFHFEGFHDDRPPTHTRLSDDSKCRSI